MKRAFLTLCFFVLFVFSLVLVTKIPSKLQIIQALEHHADNKCESLLKKGHWGSDFKLNGYERKISENLTIINPWDDRYPFDPWPPYKRWPYQNYSGTWKSDSKCEIQQEFSFDNLSKCFQNKTTILYMGDSRTRQLYTSLKMIFENETIFRDYIGTATDDTFINKVGRLKFIRSKTFWYLSGASSYEYNILKGLQDSVSKLENDERMIVVIGEQIVWPMKSYFEHYIPWNRMFSNFSEKRTFGENYRKMARDWVRYFCIGKLENYVMPGVLKILEENGDRVKIVFMGSTSRLNNRERLWLYKDLLGEYNFQMHQLIAKIP